MKTTYGSRASICKWELRFSFLCKEQCQKFIKLLMKDSIDFIFSYEKVMTDTGEHYVIDVECHWAHNLTKVAKMIEKVDHRMD